MHALIDGLDDRRERGLLVGGQLGLIDRGGAHRRRACRRALSPPAPAEPARRVRRQHEPKRARARRAVLPREPARQGDEVRRHAVLERSQGSQQPLRGDVAALGLVLPVFGFLTLGMHAGYAVYFPELFPTRLRGTGAGFCFNAGRILAAPILILTGLMQGPWDMSQENAASLLSLLFVVGIVALIPAPETRGQELPK